jgi:predicted enzyme related to lactoylglutathione lyase
MTFCMKLATSSYVEHVAIRVHDVHRHIRFFHEVLGQTLRDVDASADHPKQ